jgi:hypothetical protein
VYYIDLLIIRFSSIKSGNEANTNNDQLKHQPETGMMKMERPKIPLKPYIRFSVKYRSLFRAKYPDASVAGNYEKIDYNYRIMHFSLIILPACIFRNFETARHGLEPDE